MQRKDASYLCFLILLPCIVLCSSCASIIGVKPEASITATVCQPSCTKVSVQVIEEQGQPVMGAGVRILTDEDTEYIAQATDVEGYANIENPRESKNCFLVITASGFMPFASDRFSVANGQRISIKARITVDPAKVVE